MGVTALVRGEENTYLAAWNHFAGGPIEVRPFDGRGAALGALRRLADRAGSAFALARRSGGFVAAWIAPGSPPEIVFRLLGPDGEPVGEVRSVVSLPGPPTVVLLSVAADAAGDLVVAWSQFIPLPGGEEPALSVRGFYPWGDPASPGSRGASPSRSPTACWRAVPRTSPPPTSPTSTASTPTGARTATFSSAGVWGA